MTPDETTNPNDAEEMDEMLDVVTQACDAVSCSWNVQQKIRKALCMIEVLVLEEKARDDSGNDDGDDDPLLKGLEEQIE